MKLNSPVLAAAVLLLAVGCDGYDAPDEAEPFESIAPAPGDTVPVPGADEPGSQPVP